ncbi:glycosyl transferase [Desulfosporosinus acidiphilus SJ4]|uniref:Glycosyl transferase n=2 Tax=Desulfosporosinus TaxID=79206 RepID=I4DAA9_DESAJ|nr:glycosyl transferase [Desulfosporosinus acidiphilus SJ4]
MITISLCMIVKNEERLIKRCLECVKDFVDEIIIVDTGSTDRTKEIAGDYTSRIYDFEWIDDFAAARNFCFSKATMDYIYNADADEVIDKENIEKFFFLKNTLNPDVDIVEMQYTNQLEKGSTYNFDTENRPKLFKRLRTFRWIDPIHEVINCSNNVITSDIKIIHKPEDSHSQRDLSIFIKCTGNGQVLNSRLHMMYARELFICGNDEDFYKAFAYFNMSLMSDSLKPEDKRLSCCVLARYYHLKSDVHNFFKVITKTLNGIVSSELCCELGSYYMTLEDYEEALYWYYLASSSASADLNIDYMNFIPNVQMCQCFIKLGNLTEALQHNTLAGFYKPNHPAVLANMQNLNKLS